MSSFERLPAPESLAEDRILPWPQVRPIAGISRTTAWRLQNTGDFPRPVVLSPGRVGWRESEVQAWRASRVPRGQPAPAPLFEPLASGPSPLERKASAKPKPAPSPGPPAALQASRPKRPPRRSRPVSANQLSFDF